MIALNTPALIIGWAFMLAGGVILAAAAIGVALDMLWGKLKDAHNFAWLQEAAAEKTAREKESI